IRLGADVDETALGDSTWAGNRGEPDYSLLLEPVRREGLERRSGAEAPRVARVEPTEVGCVIEEPDEGTVGVSKDKVEPSSLKVEGTFQSGRMGEGAARVDMVSAEDPRELIPAESDRLSRVEALLTKVMEENQALRRQLQSESNSLGSSLVFQLVLREHQKDVTPVVPRVETRNALESPGGDIPSDSGALRRVTGSGGVEKDQVDGRVFVVFGENSVSTNGRAALGHLGSMPLGMWIEPVGLDSCGPSDYSKKVGGVDYGVFESGVHSLSVDISGPFIKGRSYDVEASGRDKGDGYRYFLAGAYTIPDKFGAEKEDVQDTDDYYPSDDEQLVKEGPVEEGRQGFPDDFLNLPELFEDEVGVKVVTRRFKGKQAEPAELEELPTPVTESVPKESYRTLFIGEWEGEVRWVIAAFVPRDVDGTAPESWTESEGVLGVTVDVKSAFLYAPIRWQEREYLLQQTKTDDALWLIKPADATSAGETVGVLVVYVDDLACFGPEGLLQAFLSAVQAKWKTSPPEWLGERPVTFCGIEIARNPTGYRLTQCAYTKELINRYNIEESCAVPIHKWVEPEPAIEPSVDDIRAAQGVTGALLWLSTRTRPDLSYVVSRCGQQATKAPQVSIALGRQALSYLRGTLDVGIDVPFAVGSPFSDHGLLSLPRTDKVLELYTDASHSPGGDRSMQSSFVVWRGVPVAWEVVEAVQPLIDELIEDDSVIALLADNEAAISRERVEAGLLKARLMQLLELVNVRSAVGLAILAAVPQVTGQPTAERFEEGTGWLLWFFGVLVTVACLMWGWWIAQGSEGSEEETSGFSEGEVAGLGIEVRGDSGGFSEEVAVADTSPARATLEPASAERAVEEDDDFTEEEWARAQAKLISEELRVGLTLVQRARVRRAISRGDVVDPPTFQQRQAPVFEVSVGAGMISDLFVHLGVLLATLLGAQETDAGNQWLPLAIAPAEESGSSTTDPVSSPAQSWSLTAIQDVVRGLETGVWPDWTQALQDIQSDEGESNASGSAPGREFAQSSGWTWLALGFWMRFFVVFWVCMGTVGGTSELVIDRALVDCSVSSCVNVDKRVVAWADDAVSFGTGGGCDGSTLWEVSKVLIVIVTWEILRRSWTLWTGRKATPLERESQTDDSSFVPLPLPQGIPYRARILFSLWRAGYKIDSEFYPQEVQDELHWLIGDHLVALEEGDPLDDSSG
ncbi:true, partial [Symbiodinium sp. CCMP2456]